MKRALGVAAVLLGLCLGAAPAQAAGEFPDAEVEVIKLGAGDGIITSAPNGIACGPVCSGEFEIGSTVTLSAEADAHSVFVGWSVAPGASPCPGTGPCRVGGVICPPMGGSCPPCPVAECGVALGAGPEVVYAEFAALPTHTLTVTKTGAGAGTITSSPAGIDCAGPCSAQSAQFNADSTATLTASARRGSAFVGWSVAGVPGACPGTGTCTVAMSAEVEVDAEFEALPQQSLSVSKSGSGEGTITSSPAGIECGAVCLEDFDAGSSVTLSANPQPHSTFVGWSGGGCSGTGTCEVSLNAATSVVAQFEATRRTLSLATSGPGRVQSAPAGIDCGDLCSALFPEGAAITLTPVPAPGYRFAGFSGGGCGGTRDCRVTLDADTHLGASFVPLRRSLAISLQGPGFGSVMSQPGGIACGTECAAVFDQGTTVTLTATPDPESRFAGFSGCDAVSANRCTVTLSSSKTILASFAEAPPKKSCPKKSRAKRAKGKRAGKCKGKPAKPKPDQKGKR